QPRGGEDQIHACLVNRRRRERNRLFRELVADGSIVSARRHVGSLIESAEGPRIRPTPAATVVDPACRPAIRLSLTLRELRAIVPNVPYNGRIGNLGCLSAARSSPCPLAKPPSSSFQIHAQARRRSGACSMRSPPRTTSSRNTRTSNSSSREP